jgi:hypothetical protein
MATTLTEIFETFSAWKTSKTRLCKGKLIFLAVLIEKNLAWAA